MGIDSSESNNIDQLICKELDKLQPYIASHGGKIEFVKFQDSVVYVELQGTCVQCPLSFYTLTYGLERQLKSKISEISRVEAVNID